MTLELGWRGDEAIDRAHSSSYRYRDRDSLKNSYRIGIGNWQLSNRSCLQEPKKRRLLDLETYRQRSHNRSLALISSSQCVLQKREKKVHSKSPLAASRQRNLRSSLLDFVLSSVISVLSNSAIAAAVCPCHTSNSDLPTAYSASHNVADCKVLHCFSQQTSRLAHHTILISLDSHLIYASWELS